MSASSGVVALVRRCINIVATRTGMGSTRPYRRRDVAGFCRLTASDDWREAEPRRNKWELLEAVHERTGLAFVLVPGGSFEMGSNEWVGLCPMGRPGLFDSRPLVTQPVHRVKVPAFLICKTQCTQRAWDKLGGDDGRTWRGADLPIESVTWNAVQAWCRKAGLRLPSEAEWEYACRAGQASKWYFGDSPAPGLSLYGWYSENGDKRTHDVGTTYHAHGWGLFDMHGNVWEWCEDGWHENYTRAPSDGSAWTDGDREKRVVRGGGWKTAADFTRSATRAPRYDSLPEDDVGLRPAMSLPRSR